MILVQAVTIRKKVVKIKVIAGKR